MIVSFNLWIGFLLIKLIFNTCIYLVVVIVPVEMWKIACNSLNNKSFIMKKSCGKSCGKHVGISAICGNLLPKSKFSTISTGYPQG
jgi:hypothetical protein